jgi:hypothetical protein
MPEMAAGVNGRCFLGQLGMHNADPPDKLVSASWLMMRDF